jgi:hypothetical protein
LVFVPELFTRLELNFIAPYTNNRSSEIEFLKATGAEKDEDDRVTAGDKRCGIV